jgi:hypothetical protein
MDNIEKWVLFSAGICVGIVWWLAGFVAAVVLMTFVAAFVAGWELRDVLDQRELRREAARLRHAHREWQWNDPPKFSARDDGT